MTTPELLPCPFCGYKHVGVLYDPLNNGGSSAYVACPKCGAVGVPHMDEATAIAAWNRRVSNPGKPEGEEDKA